MASPGPCRVSLAVVWVVVMAVHQGPQPGIRGPRVPGEPGNNWGKCFGNCPHWGSKKLPPPPTGAQLVWPHPQPGRSALPPAPNRGAVRLVPTPTGEQPPAPQGAQGPKRHICLRPSVSGVSQTFETRCNRRRQAFSTRRLRLVGRTLQVCPLILCSRQESNSCTCAPDRTRAIDLYSRYAGSRCRWRMRGDFSL